MFRRILVPLDGSKEGETILSWVQRIASPRSEVHLLHVVPQVHAPVGMETTYRLPLHEQGETYLAVSRGRWLSDQPGADLVRPGDPSLEIQKAALEKNVDLIAMTTHARRGIARFLLGSVAAEIVRRAQLPVFLARPDMLGTSRGIERILVSVEGTQAPKDLLETVKTFASESHTEIVLFHALPIVKDPAPQWVPAVRLTTRPPAEARLFQLADSLEEEGYRAWALVSEGEPAEQIVAQAERLKADLVALSTHGHEGFERVLEGSVAESVLRRSPVPVLLQKPLIVHKFVPLGETHG